MADIPVERTGGGIPWWVWLLGLLALLGIGLLLFSGDDDPDVAVVDETEDMVVDEPVDDQILLIETEDDLDAAIVGGQGEGSQVNLRNVEVMRVVGDSTFVIGSGNRETLVILAGLGESETGAGGSDGRFNVDQGDRVTITGGALTRYRDNMPGTLDLTDADREMAERRQMTLTVREAGNIVVENR